MSKHLKKNNLPAPSSDDDDDSLNQDLPTPGAADPVTTTAAVLAKVPGKDVGVEPSSPPATDDNWRRVAEQIDSLRAVLLNLVTLVASSMALGRPQETLLSGDEQGFLQGVSEGPLVHKSAAMAVSEGASAITAATAAMWREAANLATAAGAWSEPAILAEPRGARLTEAASPKYNGAGRSHRPPNIEEFVAGGDWSAFTWRFGSAFCSVWWTEEEALDALPTLLDDISLAVFRSIPLEKKKTFKDAFAEVAEVYEPPSNAQRKLMHRCRGANEFPLAYHGTLLAFAMAAYPDSTLDILDPLILARMLMLSKKMGISLPVCGHEPLMSRWQLRVEVSYRAELDPVFPMVHAAPIRVLLSGFVTYQAGVAGGREQQQAARHPATRPGPTQQSWNVLAMRFQPSSISVNGETRAAVRGRLADVASLVNIGPLPLYNITLEVLTELSLPEAGNAA
ncbi:unnamed protein product [Lampetra planeri]